MYLDMYVFDQINYIIELHSNGLYIPQPVVPANDSITQLFHKHAGEDGKMDYKELRRFLQEATERGIIDQIQHM